LHTLALICRSVAHLFKQVWLFFKHIPDFFRHRARQAARNELEAERLDRIRNPSKYRGM